MDDRITTLRFELDSTADWVTAKLLEASRRTGLTLVSLSGDGIDAYPRDAWNADVVASAWRAKLSLAGDADVDEAVSTFLARAETFLDARGGVRAESPRSEGTKPHRARRSNSAYGLDGSFLAAQNSSV